MLHHTVAWPKALTEVGRVLRPGGRLVGYDLLDTAVARLMHFGESEDSKVVRRGDLHAELSRVGLASVRTRAGVGGLVVRFTATKPHRGAASSQ